MSLRVGYSRHISKTEHKGRKHQMNLTPDLKDALIQFGLRGTKGARYVTEESIVKLQGLGFLSSYITLTATGREEAVNVLTEQAKEIFGS